MTVLQIYLGRKEFVFLEKTFFLKKELLLRNLSTLTVSERMRYMLFHKVLISRNFFLKLQTKKYPRKNLFINLIFKVKEHFLRN